MTEVDSVLPKVSIRKNDPAVKAASSNEALAAYLLTQVSLNDDGVYFAPDCPLCSSPNRSSIECQWLENRDAKEAHSSLKSLGEPIPLTVIKNHMEFHIDQSYMELRKREFIKKLTTLNELNLDTISRIDLNLDCLHQQILNMAASESPTMDQVELNKKRADAMCKLVSSTASLLAMRATMLGEMHAQGETLIINKDDFELIFRNALQRHQGQEARAAINELLENFSAAIRRQ
jgi:hypothetical protein